VVFLAVGTVSSIALTVLSYPWAGPWKAVASASGILMARTEPGIETAHVPILDGSPPSDYQFREAAHWVERWRAEGQCVLVHCAQAHGTTATDTAAMLLRLRLAPDVEEALSMVKAARPLAKPSRQQKAALIRYASERLSQRR
jgi:protein-tyrosine phosphatase